MFHSKEKNLPALLFSLILEKSSILSKFNFAPDIQIHLKQALDTSACIINELNVLTIFHPKHLNKSMHL